jgi:hypothetical protein
MGMQNPMMNGMSGMGMSYEDMLMMQQMMLYQMMLQQQQAYLMGLMQNNPYGQGTYNPYQNTALQRQRNTAGQGSTQTTAYRQAAALRR